MRLAHTPGPWAWNESQHVLRAANPDPATSAIHTILEVGCGYAGFVDSDSDATYAEGEADLRLIAAAPELVEALAVSLSAMLEAQHVICKHDDDVPAELLTAIDAAIAAIGRLWVKTP